MSQYNNFGNDPAPFIFRDPDGTIHTGVGIRSFAKQNGLEPTCMQRVHDGERNHHRGWTALEDYQLAATQHSRR